jgi:hypothetical protein
MVDTRLILQNYSFDLIFPIFSKYFYKPTIITIPNSLTNFLNEESIVLDEETMSSLDETFIKNIQKVLSELECVFIKLNWSSANDSHFLNQGLKCFTIKDILRLLKGSTKLFLDLKNVAALKNEQKVLNPILVMFKWYEIEPKNEFRCFVIGKELKAICQRNPSHFYSYSEDEISNYKILLITFIQNLFKEDEVSQFLLTNHYNVIDVYITRKNNIKIIDIGGRYKDLLLFSSWEEIKELKEFSLKYIQKHCDSRIPQYLENKVPIEAFEYGGITKLLEMIEKSEREVEESKENV